jgi:glutamyl-tRNA reductase
MKNEILNIAVIGINHNTATVAQREKFQLDRKKIRSALSYFKSMQEVEGIVIVSTCNRLEFYFSLNRKTNLFSVIMDFYSEEKIIDTPANKNLFYEYNGIEAVKHLFSVTTGLDSMLLGEYQVQGQIKDAYSIACSEKTTDKILHKLFHAAFRIGKTVRTKTKIGSGNQSLSGVAFNIIKEKLHSGDVITIVGVNQNTKIIADKLFEAGFSNLLFVNRTLHKAQELAAKFKGTAFSLDKIDVPLSHSKCLFSCTGAPGCIISSELINKIYLKSGFPKLIIDMAVPRDVEPNGIINDVELIDLESLKKYLELQKKEISFDLPIAEKIISGEADIFEAWGESQYDERIFLLNEKMETIRLQLLNETSLQISEDEFELLDKYSRSLTHRIKSILIQSLKIKDNKQRDLITPEVL